jgi:hypothetical protein
LAQMPSSRAPRPAFNRVYNEPNEPAKALHLISTCDQAHRHQRAVVISPPAPPQPPARCARARPR